MYEPDANLCGALQVMLWPEEMADATLLVLSARDDLVPSEMVQAHLSHTNSPCKVQSGHAASRVWHAQACIRAGVSAAVQVLCHPTSGHGGFLLDPAFGKQVLHEMQEVMVAGTLLAKKGF